MDSSDIPLVHSRLSESYEIQFNECRVAKISPDPSDAEMTDIEPDGSGAAYKFRGIECQQDNTPLFVAETQAALVQVFDQTRASSTVIDRL